MPTGPQVIPTRPKYKAAPQLTSKQRGYGVSHQKVRQVLIQRFPICQICGLAWSQELHHKDGRPENRDMDNLLMTCIACHHQVHRRHND